MAKKTATKPANATAKVAPAEPPVTTVKDLEARHGLPGKTIRVIIRGLGFRAPKTNLQPGELGPTAKYEWSSEDPKHQKALAAIEIAILAFKENANEGDDE